MIPNFPIFEKLSLEDELEVRSYTDKYKPYSDFNFTSLWSWDTQNQRQISDLNGNLVVYFTDYKTNEPFLSFMGENKVNKTASELINYSKEKGLSEKLDLISEETISSIDKSEFLVEPSIGNTDYIFDVSLLAYLQGKKFKSKRNLSKNFLSNNIVNFDFIPLKEQTCGNQLFSLIRDWEKNKIKEGKNYQINQEELSIKRLLTASSSNEKLFLSTVLIDKKIVGFSIDEILVNDYSISHFIKADILYKGIYEFMNEKIAEKLQQHGSVYWNWEQDLGVESLKLNKLSYFPVEYLNKYVVKLKK